MINVYCFVCFVLPLHPGAVFLCIFHKHGPGPGQIYEKYIKAKNPSKKTAIFCILAKKNKNIL